MPRRRRTASNVSGRNQRLPACDGYERTMRSIFLRATASVSGRYRLGVPRSPSYLGISYSRIRWSRIRVPGQLGDHPVVLVPVVPVVRQHHVGAEVGLGRLEGVLDLGPLERQVAVAELVDDDLPVGGLRQKAGGAGARLALARRVATRTPPSAPSSRGARPAGAAPRRRSRSRCRRSARPGTGCATARPARPATPPASRNDGRLGDRHDELAAPAADVRELRHDLVLEVPGQDQDVVGLALDRSSRARRSGCACPAGTGPACTGCGRR